MGDYNIVAAITRALAYRLQNAINRTGGPIAQALVTTRRLDRTDATNQPQINLFLFHVLPNPFGRNLNQPTQVDGRRLSRPTVALDLYYLLSFSGSDDVDKLESQQLLGIAAAAFEAEATLDAATILRANPELAAEFAHFPIAAVQINPHSLTIEELSRTWTMFAQVPYLLSTCYRVSAALIEADVPLQPSAPTGGGVRTSTAPALRPTISGVTTVSGGPVTYGETLRITGSEITHADVITLGAATLKPVSIVGDAIEVSATGSSLSAGLIPLRVASGGVVSEPLPLLLGPRLNSCTVRVASSDNAWAGQVTVTLAPTVQPGQLVELELFPIAAGNSYAFQWAGNEDGRRARVSVTVSGMTAGTYAVRVKVDGAPSVLARDAQGGYAGPFVVIGPRRGRA